MQLVKGIVAFAALCVFSGTGAAVGNIADVAVYDRAAGHTLPVYRHEERYYVVGQPGNEYQVRVRNRTGAEILAVVSVDGVNAVSGETANWEQTGYVLSPYQSYDIKGWRKSLQRVAAFFFTELPNSYAARTGRPDNVGVIGVALFRKKHEPQAYLHRDRLRREAPAATRSSGAAEDAGAASAAAPQSEAAQGTVDSAARSGARGWSSEAEAGRAPQPDRKIGTGHGRSETSHITHTEFERATDAPAEMIVIQYDTYRNLVARGVIRAPRVATSAPTPFPGQFVPDPR